MPLPPTKLSQLLALMDQGKWHDAIRFAAKFPVLGDQEAAIRKANEAILRPDFQRQIGRDPAALIEGGIAALKQRYLERKPSKGEKGKVRDEGEQGGAPRGA